MKKWSLLLVLCAIAVMGIANFFYVKSCEDDAPLLRGAWLSAPQEPYLIRILFWEDYDGILPIDQPSYWMSVYDWGTGAEPLLDGYDLWEGSWIYDGTWSLKNNILTLRTDDGNTIQGTVADDTILLDVGEGYLLEKHIGEE